jgi:hypothetical protein
VCPLHEKGISTMDLFNTEPLTNQLPYEGEVLYYGKILTRTTIAALSGAKCLGDIAWKNDEAIIFGRHIITKRKVSLVW